MSPRRPIVPIVLVQPPNLVSDMPQTPPPAVFRVTEASMPPRRTTLADSAVVQTFDRILGCVREGRRFVEPLMVCDERTGQCVVSFEICTDAKTPDPVKGRPFVVRSAEEVGAPSDVDSE